jgi:ATP-binding cassette subfamily B (MDR/TAP) protein 1
MRRQVRELQLAVSQPLGMLLLETMTALASVGTALFFSWKLTLVILATFPVAAGMLYFISKGVGSAIESQKRELSRASKYASNAVTAVDSVKAFNGQDQEVWQYFLTAKAITKYYLIQARSNALQFGIIKFFAVGLYVSSFWFGLFLVLHGGSTVGRVLTTFVSCASAMQAAEIVLPQFLVLAKGISAGETLKSIMAAIQDGRTTKNEDGDLVPEVCPGDIEINDVGKSSSFERIR